MAKKIKAAKKLTVSSAVASIIKVAKSAGVTHTSATPKRIRMYIGDKDNRKPVLLLRGLSSENPTVKIKPALRGESWKQYFHGKLQQKNFHLVNSGYIYKGDRNKLLSRVKIAVRLITLAHKAS